MVKNDSMIKITYYDLNRGEFVETLNRIHEDGRFTPKVAYAFLKINQACEKELKNARNLYAKLVEAHAQKDETGKVKSFEDAPYKIIEGQEEAFAKEQDELLKVEFTVPFAKVPIDQLDRGITLTPSELASIEPIIEFGTETI